MTGRADAKLEMRKSKFVARVGVVSKLEMGKSRFVTVAWWKDKESAPWERRRFANDSLAGGGGRKCGKQRGCRRVFLDLWQGLDLGAIFRKCGK